MLLAAEAMGSPLAASPRLGPTLMFLGDGYGTDAAFHADVDVLWQALIEIDPLHCLETAASSCTVYAVRSPSSLGVHATPDGRLQADPQALLELLGTLELDGPGGEIVEPLRDLAWANDGGSVYATALPVVVCPSSHATGHGEWIGSDPPELPYHVVVEGHPDSALAIAKAIGRAVNAAGEWTDPALEPPWTWTMASPNQVSAAVDDLMQTDPATADVWAPLRAGGDTTYETVTSDWGEFRRISPGGVMAFAIGGPALVASRAITVAGLKRVIRNHLRPWLAGPQPSVATQQLVYHEARFADREPLAVGSTTSRTGNHGGYADWWEYELTADPGGIRFDGVCLRTPDHANHSAGHGTGGGTGHGAGGGTGHDHHSDHHAQSASSPPPTNVQPVARRISFHDLAVEVSDGSGTTSLPIDLSSGEVTRFELGTNPTSPDHQLMQEGVLLVAVVAVQGDTAATSVLVEVELACAFRWPAADFDPPGAIEACQAFPQISFRQLTPPAEQAAAFAGRVRRFHGTVRIDADVHTPPWMRDHMVQVLFGGPDAPQAASFPTAPVNFAALFTDMYNLTWNVASGVVESAALHSMRRKFLDIAATPMPSIRPALLMAADVETLLSLKELLLAGWLGIFDYVKRLEAPEVGRSMVAAHLDPLANVARSDSVVLPWRNQAITAGITRRVYKEARQTGYDNIHVHGTMGTVADFPAIPGHHLPRVMAPGCGHSCFHSHWRWGNSTVFMSGFRSPGFWGAAQLLAQVAVFDVLDARFDPLVFDDDEVATIAEALITTLSFGYLTLVSSYKGWSNDGRASRRATVVGAPVMPPNQALELSVTGAAEVGVPDPTVLDDDTKVVDFTYRVECDDTFDAAWRHAVGEFGIGVAVRYAPSPAEVGMRMLTTTAFGDLRFLPQGVIDSINGVLATRSQPQIGPSYDLSVVWSKAYDVIPFLHFNRSSSVPDYDTASAGGDWIGASGTRLEDR